ncbi:MAG: hypothetical protein ACI9XP_001228 [Lentimonas sp.]|jgi:hypothetical protein
MKFFRKIRYGLIEKNKIGTYIKYAIGEIILVVIGILIALSINNWNGNRKSERLQENILKEIELNLKTDVASLTNVISRYEQLEAQLNSIIIEDHSSIDTINSENYVDCNLCNPIIGKFISFEIQNKGIELLKGHINDNTKVQGDITHEIIQFYKNAKMLTVVVDKLKEESFNNLKYFEQFSWYSDYMNKKYNLEAITFFATNRIYKNKVVTYKLIAIDNFLMILKNYKNGASNLLDKIRV